MKNLFLFALIVCIVGLIPLSYAQSDTESEEITDQDVAIGVIFFIGIPAAAVIIIVILIKKNRQKNKELKQAGSRIKKQKKHLSKMEQSNYVKPTDTKKDSLFCVSCGAKLNSKAKFCKECGSNQATQS